LEIGRRRSGDLHGLTRDLQMVFDTAPIFERMVPGTWLEAVPLEAMALEAMSLEAMSLEAMSLEAMSLEAVSFEAMSAIEAMTAS
jgi:hypothetical protein